jgi:hypothetical protein
LSETTEPFHTRWRRPGIARQGGHARRTDRRGARCVSQDSFTVFILGPPPFYKEQDVGLPSLHGALWIGCNHPYLQPLTADHPQRHWRLVGWARGLQLGEGYDVTRKGVCLPRPKTAGVRNVEVPRAYPLSAHPCPRAARGVLSAGRPSCPRQRRSAMGPFAGRAPVACFCKRYAFHHWRRR